MTDESIVVKVKSYGDTNVGQTRELNEDNLLWGNPENGDFNESKSSIQTISDRGTIYVIADGMGGSAAGEVASEIAINSVSKQFLDHKKWSDSDREICDLLSRWIYNAHLAIVEEAVANVEHLGMGTTLTIGLILNQKLYLSWSGDSRVYRFSPKGERIINNYDSKFLQILTPEHSLVWEMVERGEISVEDARVHAQSHVITQSLGDYNMPPKPSSKVVALRKGDRILFCSDGLNSMVPDYQIESTLSLMNSPEETVEELINNANEKGGYDNITIILTDVIEGPQTAALVDEDDKSDLTTRPAVSKQKVEKNIPPVIENEEVTSLVSEEKNESKPVQLSEIDQKIEAAAQEERQHERSKSKVKGLILAALTLITLCAVAYWLFTTDKQKKNDLIKINIIKSRHAQKMQQEHPVIFSGTFHNESNKKIRSVLDDYFQLVDDSTNSQSLTMEGVKSKLALYEKEMISWSKSTEQGGFTNSPIQPHANLSDNSSDNSDDGKAQTFPFDSIAFNKTDSIVKANRAKELNKMENIKDSLKEDIKTERDSIKLDDEQKNKNQ